MPPKKKAAATPMQHVPEENMAMRIHECWDALHAREQAPYDGVLGRLPAWIPENFHRMFSDARNRILDEGYTPQYVQTVMSEERQRNDEALRLPTMAISYEYFPCPPDVRRAVRTLIHLQTAVELGKDNGLAFLLDPSHASIVKKGEQYGQHQSRIAKQPRGKFDGRESATINELIGHLARRRPDESARELWPHFYNTLDEEDLDPHEQRDPAIMTYDFNGKRKPLTLGTFEKVVSQYRTGKKKLP